MADVKVFPERLVKVTWVPDGGVANPQAPTAAELNAGVDLTTAIAWDGFELGASDSSDIDDASLADAAGFVEPGFDQYNASLSLFYPADMTDVSSDYVAAYETFKTRVTGWLYMRVNGGLYTVNYAAGDVISGFKVITDFTAHDAEGEDSVKFNVEFLPQGFAYVNTMVAGAAAVTPSSGTSSISVGGVDPISVTISGYDWTQGCTWSSDDTSVATVSQNGVITGVSAGGATVTASHPASATPATVTVTVT